MADRQRRTLAPVLLAGMAWPALAPSVLAQPAPPVGRILSEMIAAAGTGVPPDAVPAASNVFLSQPARLFVCAVCTDETTGQTALTASYTQAEFQPDGSLLATARITTGAQSRFLFQDRYSLGSTPGTFKLDRAVTVTAAAPGDRGFNTQILIGLGNSKPISSFRFFAPGIWYGDNADAGQFGGFETGPATDAYWREIVSSLPLVSMQDARTGLSIAMAHVGSTPTSDGTEASRAWLVDGAVQYGSLGIQKLPQTSIGFTFPADETVSGGWVRRSHPVTVGFTQHYSLIIAVGLNRQGLSADFNGFLAQTWRRFYDLFAPAPVAIPVDTVFADGIGLFDTDAMDFNGAEGLPFTASLSTDQPIGISYEMGYVGQQIPAGYELLRTGLLSGNPAEFAKGKAMLDFWAGRSAQPSGLPLTWYNVTPPTFRNTATAFPLFIRTLSDGMEGMVEAATFMRQHRQPQPRWETFASAFGDWLVRNQNADGSFYRYYQPNGSVFVFPAATPPIAPDRLGFSKLDTTHPVRFLVELYFATGNPAYLHAALAAGHYALTNIYGPGRYVGGIDSNPAVIDREAGAEALHAALALYDATQDPVWLAAARHAADYTETWLYAWNFPIGGDAPAFRYAGTRGQSLIGTAGPATDIFLSSESYDFYRLHLLGDDAENHDLSVADLLQDNTKLTTELGGIEAQQFGYALPGLVSEAANFAELAVDEPTIQWLPWLTEAELQPLRRMDETFGALSIEQAQAQSASQLDFENTHIYPAPGSLGWTGTP